MIFALIPIIFFVILIKRGIITASRFTLYTEIFTLLSIVLALIPAFFHSILIVSAFVGGIIISASYLSLFLGFAGVALSLILLRKELNKKLAISLLIISIICIPIGLIEVIGKLRALSFARQERIIKENKFDELSERFRQPQKVIDVIPNESWIILDEQVYVTLNGLGPDDYRKNPDIGSEITNFIKNSIVGNYVEIILPETVINERGEQRTYKEVFGEHGNMETPIVTADVYYNGESINEKFKLK